MLIPRWLLIGVLVAGLLATLRLGWVVRDYTGAIDTLQRIEFVVTGVTRESDDTLLVELEIRNGSRLAVEVQSLHLNAYAGRPTQLGATYTPFEGARVEGRSTLRVTRVITIINPEQIEDAAVPLRFRGESLLRLPVGDRYFPQRLSLTWDEGV
jgi:hypothetical protein